MPLLGPQGREQLRVLGRHGTVGLEMGLSVAVGFFGGRWLDGLFGTGPWLKWIGLGFGLAAGFRALYRVARQVRDELEDDGGATDDDDGTPRNR
ncbi:MAG: AtpZ/AtpI family protein [Polyangiales bacterium]